MADTIPTQAKLIGEMERFAAAARKVGLAAHAHRLRTLTTSAIAAGFDFAAKLH